jgi:hypothetical protein
MRSGSSRPRHVEASFTMLHLCIGISIFHTLHRNSSRRRSHDLHTPSYLAGYPTIIQQRIHLLQSHSARMIHHHLSRHTRLHNAVFPTQDRLTQHQQSARCTVTFIHRDPAQKHFAAMSRILGINFDSQFCLSCSITDLLSLSHFTSRHSFNPSIHSAFILLKQPRSPKGRYREEEKGRSLLHTLINDS